MQTIRLIHWKAEEAEERAARLAALGYSVDCRLPSGRSFLRELAQDPPDAVLIDLSRLPSQGRDLAIQIRRQAATRQVSLVFAGGQETKVVALRKLLPDAVYAQWSDLGDALARAIANPPRQPFVPDSAFAAYAGRPLIDKLGIKPGFAVALVNAPEAFETTLGALPDGARLFQGAGEPCALTLWFLSSARQLEADLPAIVTQTGYGPVWLAWPKKASGVKSDLTQKVVRDAGLGSGLVDYKICSIDETWSALIFTIRKGT
jgi:hypothetical protein